MKSEVIRREQDELLRQFEKSLQSNFEKLMKDVKDKVDVSDSDEEEDSADYLSGKGQDGVTDSVGDHSGHFEADNALLSQPAINDAPDDKKRSEAWRTKKQNSDDSVEEEVIHPMLSESSESDLDQPVHRTDIVSKYSDGDDSGSGSFENTPEHQVSMRVSKTKVEYQRNQEKVNLSGKLLELKSGQKQGNPVNPKIVYVPQTKALGPQSADGKDKAIKPITNKPNVKRLNESRERKSQPAIPKQSNDLKYDSKVGQSTTNKKPNNSITQTVASSGLQTQQNHKSHLNEKASNSRASSVTKSFDKRPGPSIPTQPSKTLPGGSFNNLKTTEVSDNDDQSLKNCSKAESLLPANAVNQKDKDNSKAIDSTSKIRHSKEGSVHLFSKDRMDSRKNSNSRMGKSVTSFSREKRPGPAQPKLSSRNLKTPISGSMISVNSRQNKSKEKGNRADMNYREKYEKMKQANLKLQDNLDQLLNKHSKLLKMFQILQAECSTQKRQIEKYQADVKILNQGKQKKPNKDIGKKFASRV